MCFSHICFVKKSTRVLNHFRDTAKRVYALSGHEDDNEQLQTYRKDERASEYIMSFFRMLEYNNQ